MSAFRDSGPQAVMLPDGRRLHLQHGPIDLIVEAAGSAGEVAAAYRQAQDAFQPVLETLVSELSILRAPLDTIRQAPVGAVARRMLRAVSPHAKVFVTPMAAVAGSVADHILSELRRGRRLRRAYVNNGGDIALYLAPGESFAVGAVYGTKMTIQSGDRVRGIATSGWRGRSHSLGIADSVTVLADCAAVADVAATLIANAVTLPGAASVRRRPARALSPDSDLGGRLVTIDVGILDAGEKSDALGRGLRVAREMHNDGLIAAAALCLQDQTRILERTETKRLVHA